jgi:hypothetical protein
MRAIETHSWCSKEGNMFSNSRVAIAVVAAVLFVTAPGFAVAADIVGKFTCEGNSPTVKYSGTVVVTKRGQSYVVTWNTDREYRGVGILDGDLFAAQFSGGPEAGVMLFKLKGNNWVGTWVRVQGKGRVHEETWTKVE